jgi:arylsulfatase A-like enzyme|tara:strand:+ start:660 stop:1025 length:366 start_codon:yes stop_codon:yes gene_type:complete
MKTKVIVTLTAVLAVCSTVCSTEFSAEENPLDRSRPNIILLMADDLGDGDTGFTGNTIIIKKPPLDPMAQDGAKLTHFYAGNSACSPTLGTCLTGRHHHRYGIWNANKGHLWLPTEGCCDS